MLGANFARLLGQNFHQNERPLVVVIPANGEPAAIVPHFELSSFENEAFEGEVFTGYDEKRYQSAFDQLVRHLSIR